MKQLILFDGGRIRCSTKILLWFDMRGKRFYKYYPLIRLLIRKKLTLLEFQSIIRSFSDDTIKFICECCRNAISTCFVESLNCKQKSKLVKSITTYEKEIKAVCRKKKHFRKSRKIFLQKGYGFIFPILSAIIPLISSLISKRAKKWDILKEDIYKRDTA